MKARRTAARKPPRKAVRRSPPTQRKKSAVRAPKRVGFVGRDGSPVLDHYPPKDPSLLVRGPPVVATHSPAPAKPAAVATPKAAPLVGLPMANAAPPVPAVPKMLIALEKPFSVDDFSKLLGETTIRVVVPREDLPEVLRRVSDFMGFGIYVYSFHVRPAPSDMLKEFVLELQRVDFSAGKGDWAPFQDRGRSESPFGPDEKR
ncbi:MAG: hypothetical protein L3J96_02650 [Thermoplasmata archaeon]|nr:hypothetical protein [Thermoplasmata archaeon]